MRKVLFLAFILATLHMSASGRIEIIHHLVKPHENLFRISLVYNSTVYDIVKANPGLKPDFVRSGATIKVPAGTKVRDAAFVEALLSGKVKPEYKPEDMQVTTQAAAAIEQEDENPFMSPPVKRKSIEQMERESALENNVARKAFMPEVAAAPVAAKPAAVQPAAEPVATTASSAMPMPKVNAIYDPRQQAMLNAAEPSPAAIGVAANTNPIGAQGYQSEALQKWSKLTPFTTGTGPVNKGVISSEMAALTPNSYFAEVVRQMDLLVDPMDIKTINVQILMNDGSVQIINTPEEQKKVLAQLITGMPVPSRDN